MASKSLTCGRPLAGAIKFMLRLRLTMSLLSSFCLLAVGGRFEVSRRNLRLVEEEAYARGVMFHCCWLLFGVLSLSIMSACSYLRSGAGGFDVAFRRLSTPVDSSRSLLARVIFLAVAVDCVRAIVEIANT